MMWSMSLKRYLKHGLLPFLYSKTKQNKTMYYLCVYAHDHFHSQRWTSNKTERLFYLWSKKVKVLEQIEITKMKKHFSAKKILKGAMQLLSASKLQDSSEADTSFHKKSDMECSLQSSFSVSASDLSSEGGRGTGDSGHHKSEWIAGCCFYWSCGEQVWSHQQTSVCST